MYSQSIQPKSQIYTNTTHTTYQLEHNLGSSYANAMKQSQFIVVANVNRQAYIQGIDDDFFIAALITIVGAIPIYFWWRRKKRNYNFKKSKKNE